MFFHSLHGLLPFEVVDSFHSLGRLKNPSFGIIKDL